MSEITAYLPGFVAAYSILLVGALSPGPSVAMLIGVASRQGRTPALVATLGIACGSVTINLMTLLGVGLVLSQTVWAMSLLRVVGACYLLFLGFKAFRQAMNPPSLQSVETPKLDLRRHFVSGYLLQVSNPKAIAFWLAIASVGAVEGASSGIILLFVAGSFMISFGCHAAWAVALSSQSIRSGYIKAKRGIEIALGGFFTVAAYKLLNSTS